jgi:lysophospholipase L1-like esterase
MGTNDLATWPTTKTASKTIIANLQKMAQAVRDKGKQPILFNVPNANEARFPEDIAAELREKRDYHNPRLKEFCEQQAIPLADICSRLKDEHFGDELHPNDAGAKMIAEAVFGVLVPIHGSQKESRL